MSRASEQADLLTRLLDGEISADAAPEEARQMAAVATLLREAKPEVPPMRAEFRQELRAQVVQAARDQKAEAPLLTRMRAGIQRFKYSTGLAGSVGTASMVLAGGGVAGAAEYAQPGDVLYGTKIVLEDARLWLTSDDAAAGTRALAYAQDRLDEAAVASAGGDDRGAAIALEGAAERSREAEVLILSSGEFAPLLTLSDALSAQRAFVSGLLPQLSGPAVQAASSLLDQVEASRQSLGRTLQQAPGILVPPADAGADTQVPDGPRPDAGSVPVDPAPIQPGTPVPAPTAADPLPVVPTAEPVPPAADSPAVDAPPSVPSVTPPDGPNVQEGLPDTEGDRQPADDILDGAAGVGEDQLNGVTDGVDQGTEGILGGD